MSSPPPPPHLLPQQLSRLQQGWADRSLSVLWVRKLRRRKQEIEIVTCTSWIPTFCQVPSKYITGMVYLLQDPWELRTLDPHFTDEKPGAWRGRLAGRVLTPGPGASLPLTCQHKPYKLKLGFQLQISHVPKAATKIPLAAQRPFRGETETTGGGPNGSAFWQPPKALVGNLGFSRNTV